MIEFLRTLVDALAVIAPIVYGILGSGLLIILVFRRLYRALFGHTRGLDKLEIEARKAKLKAEIAKYASETASHELRAAAQQREKELIQLERANRRKLLEYIGHVNVLD